MFDLSKSTNWGGEVKIFETRNKLIPIDCAWLNRDDPKRDRMGAYLYIADSGLKSYKVWE